MNNSISSTSTAGSWKAAIASNSGPGTGYITWWLREEALRRARRHHQDASMPTGKLPVPGRPSLFVERTAGAVRLATTLKSHCNQAADTMYAPKAEALRRDRLRRPG